MAWGARNLISAQMATSRAFVHSAGGVIATHAHTATSAASLSAVSSSSARRSARAAFASCRGAMLPADARHAP